MAGRTWDPQPCEMPSVPYFNFQGEIMWGSALIFQRIDEGDRHVPQPLRFRVRLTCLAFAEGVLADAEITRLIP
jgi:hypothetical protein